MVQRLLSKAKGLLPKGLWAVAHGHAMAMVAVLTLRQRYQLQAPSHVAFLELHAVPNAYHRLHEMYSLTL